MKHYDQIVTDSTLRLGDLEEYLEGPESARPFHGRYWISATSGTSGQRAVIPHRRSEWATILASYARVNDWSGVRATLTGRLRMAVVSSHTLWHQSARVAQSINGRLVEVCHLDAGQPIGEIVARLNEFMPAVLVGYGSVIRFLADEQLGGGLRIAPGAVNSSSEILSPEARHRAEEAWGVRPFDVYAASETGGMAAECPEHAGLHLFEDMVLVEVVDAGYHQVGPGEPGDRLLVTVLFSRTLPLIRYELTDSVRLSASNCACGRPFRLISAVEGRSDDILELPGKRDGIVRVHPIVFHRVLDGLATSGWQIRQEQQGLRVLVAAGLPDSNAAALARRISFAVEAAGGTALSVAIEVVPAIPPGAASKRALIIGLPRAQKHGCGLTA